MTAVADIATSTQCPLCGKSEFHLKIKKILGIFHWKNWTCDNCGALFKKVGNNLYTLSSLNDRSQLLWKAYGKKSLSSREWETIGMGGLSDEDRKNIDIEKWMANLKSGEVHIECINGPTSLILQNDERILCSVPNVTLMEARSVRTSNGSYGGPSFRVAKGVYFHVGSFASRSTSHSEIQKIDSGILTVTNQRFAFSGSMKNVGIGLSKIIGMEPFSDGLALHRDGYQKTQYFTWNGNIASINIVLSGRSYKEQFSGLILQYLIEGATISSKVK